MQEEKMDYESAGNPTSWTKAYDFIYECGKAQDPKSFAIEILSNLKSLCPFDEAIIFFLDGNGKVYSQYLMNIDESWSTMYLEYYSRIEGQGYSFYRDVKEGPNRLVLGVRDWENERSEEFVPNLIRPRGLKFSCGFALHDLHGNRRTIFALDRVQNRNFSADELRNLHVVVPQLNNLHKNYFYQGFNLNAVKKASWEISLTEREAQITNLLCQGVSPANISRTLHISQSTTNKHISNIYGKMHVSSKQELLVRMLNQRD